MMKPNEIRKAFGSSPPLNSDGSSSFPVANFVAIDKTYFGGYDFPPWYKLYFVECLFAGNSIFVNKG